MFKPKSDSVKIGQDSFKIPARNGVQFTSNGILRFDITRQCGFVDASNSYLECEIELANPSNTQAQNSAQPMLTLERDIGAQSLINQLTIRAEGGRVVEEIPNYNTYAKIHYNATKTEGTLNRRSKLEGCSNSYMPQDNPYVTANKVIPAVQIGTYAGGLPTNGLINANQCWATKRLKVCLPLLGGIFTSPRSFPAMMIPLEVEIILEDALRAMRLCNQGDGRSQIVGITIPNDNAGAPASQARRTLQLEPRSNFNTSGGALATSIVPNSNPAEVGVDGQQQLNPLNNCWFKVGQVVRLNAGAGTGMSGVAGWTAQEGITRTITGVKLLGSNALNGGGIDHRGRIELVFDADIIDGTANDTPTPTIDLLTSTNQPLAGHGNFGYTIHNPRLVIAKVVPPPAVVQSISSAIAKGEYNQDIISVLNINNAIPASQSVSTNIISADLSRVKSVFCVPTSQANTDNITNSNSLQGQYLDANQYVFQYNTKIIPDRRINLLIENSPPVVQTPADATLQPYRLGSFSSGFHRYEVEKALRSANINVKDLHFITRNPSNFDTGINFNATEPATWMVARSFGAGVGTSTNMVGKSLVLYLDYRANNATPVKLLKNFLVHVRSISVGMDGVAIYY